MTGIAQFLNAGGNGYDGFPAAPLGNGVDFLSSSKGYEVDGTDDLIVFPVARVDAGNTTAGYIRANKTGSGGTFEWIINWSTIATAKSWNAATLSSGAWGKSVVKDGNIYIGFFDIGGASGTANTSWIVKADIDTGVIDTVLRIDPTNAATVNTLTVDETMKDSDFNFWEVLATGEHFFAYPTSSTTQVKKGIGVLKYASDLTTINDSGVVFTSTDPNRTFQPTSVTYKTVDSSLYMGRSSATVLWIGSPLEGFINISTSNLEGESGALIALMGILDEPRYFFHIFNEDNVFLNRHVNIGASLHSRIRSIVRRDDLDKYIKAVFTNYTGVVL